MLTPREVAEQYFAALDAADIDAAMERFTSDADFLSPAGRMQGRAQIEPFLLGFAVAFPDARFEVTGAIESGASVALEGVYSGTQSGPLTTPEGGEIPPTGRRASAPFVTLFDVEGDLITSHRAYWDQLGFMAQLGLAPK